MPNTQSTSHFTYAVCIGTYLRPHGLSALLTGIARQALRSDEYKSIVIVIVDNDSSGSARNVAYRYANLSAYDMRYVIEPVRGIAKVRNRAVKEAGFADFIVFIDDDEVPSPDWLSQLIAAQHKYHADIVHGSVVPSFPADTPSWLQQGWPLNRQDTQSGQIVDWAGCNNILYNRGLHEQIGDYDEDFALTGGEDSQFFRRAHKAGYRIVRCNEALVVETIPKTRANMKWLIKRGFQFGCTQAHIERTLNHFPVGIQLPRLLKGLCHSTIAIILIPFTMLVTRKRTIALIFRGALGIGMVAGSIGLTYEPYR